MNSSQALAQRIISSLIAGGVRDFVYCPGSRNAPFAYALARLESMPDCPIRVHVRLDERSAAFFALGLNIANKVDSQDYVRACVITTSGSAVSELYPAIAEAFYAHVPLVALSADRPIDLHGVGASQTMKQDGIFSSHVVGQWHFSTEADELASVSDRIARALAASTGAPSGVPGPVHLNCAFRDPLVPEGDQADLPECCAADEAMGGGVSVYPAQLLRDPRGGSVLDPPQATVVIAGQGAKASVLEWASRWKVPVFAEPMAGEVCSELRIPFQQTLLSDPQLVGLIEQIVVTGRPTLSRPVHALLAAGKRVVIVHSYDRWTDLYGRATSVVPALNETDRVDVERQGSLLDLLRTRALEVASGVEDLIASYGDAPSVIGVVDMVLQTCPKVFLGASNPVRIADLVAFRDEYTSGAQVCEGGSQQIWSNRGLAGIDGNTSTALGWACAWSAADEREMPVVAVMGDLTFLHDASGLGLPKGEESPNLRIVVLDDSGGSIFESLEHGRAASESMYERYFGVAQRADIPALAASYGARVHSISSMSQLREILSLPSNGVEILHVPVSRPTKDIAHLRSL